MSRAGDLFDVVSLQLLVAIADRCSIGKAARDLGLSQPSASHRLWELERRAGVVLVKRHPTGSELTEAGAAVVGWARHVVDASEAFGRSVAALKDSHERRLGVAVSKTVADQLMPWWLVSMHKLRPDVTVALNIAYTPDVIEEVRGGSAELGFIEGEQPVQGLRSREIGSDELMVAVGPQHVLNRRRQPLTLGHLASIPLVLRENGCASRETLEAALGSIGLRPSVEAEMASTAAIRAMVAAGQGVTVLSRLSLTSDVRTGRLMALSLEEAPLRLRFRAIWQRGAEPASAARDLLSIAIGAERQRLSHAERSLRARPPRGESPPRLAGSAD